MKKRHALLISILFTLLIAVNVAVKNQDSPTKTVYVTRVIDGDTFQAEDITYRLVNVNTPEKSENGFSQAKNFLSKIEETSVQIDEISTDKYGRTLVRVYTPDYLNLELVREGLATKFLVQDSELKLFDQAEKEAVLSGKGLWKKSQIYGCLNVEIFPEKEILKISSVCGKIAIKEFIVADESRKRYKFRNIEIVEVNLHSSKGEDNQTDIYWGSTDVWNNDRDTIHIYDSENNLVLHQSYGY